MSQFKNIVIFSTLNQMTNYLVIQKIKPKKIFNITYDQESSKRFGYEIKPDEWNKNLKYALKDSNLKNLAESSNFKDIYIGEGITEKPYTITEKFESYLKNIDISDAIYWHITGGQRIYLIPIYEWLKEKRRTNDVIGYIDGNLEKIIEISLDSEKNSRRSKSYGFDNLNFETAFKLMGYDTTSSTTILKDGGENKVEEGSKVKHEINFYTALYEKVITNKQVKYEVADYKDCSFMDLLLLSNFTDDFKDKNSRVEFLEKVFDEIKFKNPNDKYLQNIPKTLPKPDGSTEMNQVYPAGYIFEKIVAYNIWEEIEKNPKITSMALSQKIEFSDGITAEKLGVIDELDIVLLTNTGKIINIECKSGIMTGDNAKSHHFTSYAFSGVFGTPVFATPIYNKGDYKFKKTVEKLQKSFYAAKKAKLKIMSIDSLKKDIRNIIGD